MLKNLSVGRRLAIATTIQMALLLAVAAMALWGLHRSRSALDVIVHETEAAIQEGHALREHALNLRRYEKDMLLNLGTPAQAEYVEKWRQTAAGFEATLRTLGARELGDAERELLRGIERDFGAYRDGFLSVAEDLRRGALRTAADANDTLDAHRDAARRLSDESIVALVKLQAKKVEAQVQASFAEDDRAQSLALGLVAVALLAGVALSVALARSITAPLAVAVEAADRIARGDLRQDLRADRGDELGRLMEAMATMSEALRRSLGETQAGSNSLASAASQILAASRRTVQAAQGQATAVQETTTSAQELQETVRVTEGRARDIQDSMGRSVEFSQSIRAQLTDTAAVLTRVREEMQAIVSSIQELASRNQQIGEIIESVGDVADQTQLLAVNAGIEAAKAGDVGRGFGVVAAEMKALSDQSKRAAQRIREIVGEVQRATADTVRVVEMGQGRLQEALQPVSAIVPRVEELTVQVEMSGQSLRQILAIVQQQVVGIEQINQAMKIVQAGVQEGLVQNQQLERGAESLNTLGQQMRSMVDAYRV
jgi:methyl-accepting chemotaxis protein